MPNFRASGAHAPSAERRGLYRYQYCLMTGLCALANLFTISLVFGTAGTGAWTAYLWSLPAGLAACLPGALLFGKGNRLPLAELNRRAFGWAGRAVTAMYALGFLASAALLLNIYTLYTVDTVLHDVPPAAFLAPVLLAALWASHGSAARAGRLGVLLGVPLGGAAVIALICIFCQAAPENAWPLVSVPPQTLAIVCLALTASQYAELFSCISFAHSVQDRRRMVACTLISVLAGNALVALFAVGQVLALGQTAYLNQVPFFRATQGAGVRQLSGGLQILTVSAFFFSQLYRLTISLRAGAAALRGVLGCKRSPLLLAACGALVFVGALLLPQSLMQTTQLFFGVVPWVCLAVCFALPLVTLAVRRIRQRRGTW